MGSVTQPLPGTANLGNKSFPSDFRQLATLLNAMWRYPQPTTKPLIPRTHWHTQHGQNRGWVGRVWIAGLTVHAGNEFESSKSLSFKMVYFL